MGAMVALTAPLRAGAQDPATVAVRLRGTAYDSVAMRPLEGAVVRLVPTSDPSAARVVTAQGGGQFTIADLAAGSWLATMLHSALDSLGVDPPVMRLDVRESGDLSLVLAIPSPRTLVARQCGASPEDTGLLYGLVRDAAGDVPLVGAALTAHWPEWVIEKKRRGLRSEVQRRRAVSDSLGRFALCGVPPQSVVRVEVAQGSDTSGVLTVDIPEHGLVRRDLSLGRGEWNTTVTVDSVNGGAADTVRVRRGQASARGVVRDINGRAISNAVVRVLGSGELARSQESGAFIVTGAVSGTQTIEARAIGFQPARQMLELRDGVATEVAFTMAPQTVLLDTVRVIAGRAIDPMVADIERRWRSRATGTIMDGDEVRRRSPVFVTDALRAMNGVRVVPAGGMGQRILMRGFWGECSPAVFLDGVPIFHLGSTMFVDDLVIASDVAAMEVYPRASSVPAAFSGSGDCGAVVVWTYRRLGGVAPRDPRVTPVAR